MKNKFNILEDDDYYYFANKYRNSILEIPLFNEADFFNGFTENTLFDVNLRFISPMMISEEKDSIDSISNMYTKMPIIVIENKERTDMTLYPIDSIKNILRKHIADPDLKVKLELKNNIEKLSQYKFICYKKKTKEKVETSHSTKEKCSKKRGRKPKTNGIFLTHDKMSSDNIYKKIKAKLINEYIYNFLNDILNLQRLNISNKLVKLNYKNYINKFQKKTELNYLNMTIKDLFSLDITTKHKKLKLSDTHNKSILDKINKTDTMNFVLNLKYSDFVDLFTHKKTIEEIIIFLFNKNK